MPDTTDTKDQYVAEAEAQSAREQAAQTQAQPQPQQQDISRPSPPDRNWRRQQPIQMVVPPDRLNEDHQTVDIANVSHREAVNGILKPQVHVVVDRRMVGIEIQPGEVKRGVDMLTRDIEYFLQERDPTRKDQFGFPKPLHPVMILGVKRDKVKNARVA